MSAPGPDWTKKPREWYINVLGNKENVSEPHETRLFVGIHVIEYSAYKSAKDETGAFRDTLEMVIKQRDEARALAQNLEGQLRMADEVWKAERTLRTGEVAKSAKLVDLVQKWAEAGNIENYGQLSDQIEEICPPVESPKFDYKAMSAHAHDLYPKDDYEHAEHYRLITAYKSGARRMFNQIYPQTESKKDET